MRALTVALAALALAAPAAAASGRVAFVSRGQVIVLDLATGTERVALAHAGTGPVRWSGDGRRVSAGGRIENGPVLPAADVVWAPSGERLAYVTKRGGVDTWTPAAGRRTLLPAGWGATSLAWGPHGELAVGRSVCHAPCGVPLHQGVWLLSGGKLRRVTGRLGGVQLPIVSGFDAQGRVLWWPDPQGSGSIAADGLWLHANRRTIAPTLVYSDFVVRCGAHLALAAGGDRYATHGKRIVVDGRDVSRDTRLSWVSPSCSPDGRTLVAAAGRNWEEPRIGSGERRSIWQLLPARVRLTHPPAGWTDEAPQLLADRSILFVRTRQTSRKHGDTWITTTRGRLELLSHGRLTQLADLTTTAADTSGAFLNYYGHYTWPSLVAVTG